MPMCPGGLLRFGKEVLMVTRAHRYLDPLVQVTCFVCMAMETTYLIRYLLCMYLTYFVCFDNPPLFTGVRSINLSAKVGRCCT
jgi:hypothetical protein